MDDLEELEDDLFRTTSKRANFSTVDDPTKCNLQPTTGTKKKVVFHDFNEDDPLADLLSDEEDFPTKSNTDIKGNLVSNLFSIKSPNFLETNAVKIKPESGLISSAVTASGTAEKVSLMQTRDDWIGLSSTLSKTVPDESQRSIASDIKSNDEIASGISNETKVAGKKNKKSSLMEDLFGSRPKSNISKDMFSSKDQLVVGLDMSDIRKKSEQLSQPTTTGYAPSLSAPRDGRRNRKSFGGLVDPLGMFSSLNIGLESSEVQSSEANAAKSDHLYSTKVEDSQAMVGGMEKKLELAPEELPEWLGGPKKSNESNLQVKKNVGLSIVKSGDESSNPPHIPATALNETAEKLDHIRPEYNVEYSHDHSEHFSVLTGTQFDQQATMMSLQQQEHELKIAVTLSKQSEQLNKIIESQRIRLDNQEKQFNVLIKRQLDRQGLLEVQMKAQQDRINSHLQVLLAQPTSVPFVSSAIDNNNDSSKHSEGYDKKHSDLKDIGESLEADKLYSKNLLDRVRDQHSKEIAIIEESYIKQMEMVNQAAENLEKRLHQDMESTEADYEAKIQKMKEDQQSLKIAHGEEIEQLKKDHIQHIQELKAQQQRNLQLVRNEYIETIENISTARDIERQTISNATVQTTNLSSMLDTIKITITEIRDVKNKLEKNVGESDRAEELILKQQIEELKELKEYLKKQHENLEMDHRKSSEAMQRLDSGALRLISEFDRHVKANIEAQSRLGNREEILIREKEMLDTQIQWERNYIQAMKETWIKEQERQTQQLSEERNRIAAERVRLETLQRLKLDDNDTAKTELDAALRTVRDASNIVNQERQKWKQKLNELEIQRQQIEERENSLTLRARELEDLTQSTFEKREEGLRALKEAHYLKEQQKAYLTQLEKQSEALVQRENKLAAEKLALARERLALRTSQTDKPEKDTDKLSRPVNYITDQHSGNHSQYNDLPNSQMTTTHFRDIVDPRLVLLKLGLDNELDVTDNCLGTTHIIIE